MVSRNTMILNAGAVGGGVHVAVDQEGFVFSCYCYKVVERLSGSVKACG